MSSMNGIDYAAIFATGGQAREYFRTAAGNAAWVEGFCDGLVETLRSKAVYFAVDDPLATVLENAGKAKEIKGFTCWKTSEGHWQASYIMQGLIANITIREDINEAFSTMLTETVKRFKPGSW